MWFTACLPTSLPSVTWAWTGQSLQNDMYPAKTQLNLGIHIRFCVFAGPKHGDSID